MVLTLDGTDIRVCNVVAAVLYKFVHRVVIIMLRSFEKMYCHAKSCVIESRPTAAAKPSGVYIVAV
jgi:hypothetical protein